MSNFLGDRIRVARKLKKLSLESLAKLIGSSKSYMWELENREKPNPGAAVLHRIADALDVTTEHLLAPMALLPPDDVIDQAFFSRYQRLPQNAKKQMRDILLIIAG